MSHSYLSTNLSLSDCDLLVSHEDVTKAIKRMASEMSDDLCGENPIMICCLNGGLIFSGQLLTQLNFPLVVDYAHATRYGDKTTGSKLKWQAKPCQNLTGRTVVLLDDILDEGVTLASLSEYCYVNGAVKVLTAVLVEKLHLRKVTPGLKADYTGIEVGDRFLLGYGLDYKGYWRNAPGIYAVKDSSD